MGKELFDEVIDRRGTYCTQWDYIEDRFGVNDLLPFTISDMDFKVPDKISEALKKRNAHPIYGYTRWNHNDFKVPIVNWYNQRFQTIIELNWIVYSPSVMYTISKLIELKSTVGDQVVIQTPAYDAFFKTIKSNKREVVENKLRYEDGRYSIDFKDLEKKLAHPKAKILVLCSPHNPTGRVWTKSELLKIVDLCNRYDVFLISDEIHMDIVREGHHHTPIVVITEELKNIAICTSTSKTFNTSGLIGSYALIPDMELQKVFLDILKNRDGLSSASILGIESMMAGYKYCHEWVDELNVYVSENMHFTFDYLKQNIPEIKFIIPESTFLAWLDISELSFKMKEIQQALIAIGAVAIMDGSIYGEEGQDFLRMNLGCSKEKVLDGLERLKKAIDYLKQGQLGNGLN
ncbi:MalY/PatB family protein [Carnobacterium pleistocenium]|uniref:MalY/PatB family protein n=1 Tax=Carnobacterium pleistocenium TaxID=181073 RepID=UPI00054DB397